VDKFGGSFCGKTFLDVGYETPVVTMRVVFSVCYFIELALVTFRLVLDFTKGRTAQNLAPVFVTRLILCLLWIDIFLQLMNWALDFKGIYYVGNPTGLSFLTYIETPNLVLIFSVLLAYWIDFYQAILIKLKKEQMLKKINSAYQGNVTFEDILEQISKMRKVKIFTAVLVILGYAAFITFMSLASTSTDGKSDLNSFVGMVSWFAFVWLLLGVGFMIFGLKLCKLMPVELSSRIQRLTYKVVGVATILVIVNLFAFASNVKSIPGTELYLAKVGVVAGLTVIARLLTIDIYLPFASLKSWVSMGWSKATSSKTSTSPTSGHEDLTEDVKMEVVSTTAEI